MPNYIQPGPGGNVDLGFGGSTTTREIVSNGHVTPDDSIMNSGLRGRPHPHISGLGRTDRNEPHPGASNASPDGGPGGAFSSSKINGKERGYVIVLGSLPSNYMKWCP